LIINATISISITVLGASVAGDDGGDTRKPYPIAELLSLLAAFTFAQRTTQGLQRCLRAWAAFVAQATIGEGEGSAGEASPGSCGDQSFMSSLFTITLEISDPTHYHFLGVLHDMRRDFLDGVRRCYSVFTTVLLSCPRNHSHFV